MNDQRINAKRLFTGIGNMSEMSNNPPHTGNDYLILATLILSGATTSIPLMLSGLLLIDIGETFNTPIGITGQMRTVSYILSIFFALITSILSIRYDHKLLLQLGIVSYILSAIGCNLAPNFNAMIAAFSLTGVGYALTITMTFTMTSLLSHERRGEAIGFIIAGSSASYALGAFIVPYLQNVGGWRFSFLGYMLPVSILALALATFFIPRRSMGGDGQVQVKIGEAFRTIFSNRSALFSLFGYLLAMLAFQGVLTYNTSYFRRSFPISIGEASILMLINALSYTIGSATAGRMMKRVRRKPLAVVTIMVAGVLMMLYSNIPVFLFSVALVCVLCYSVGTVDASSTGLILDQVPLYVGVMVSFQQVFYLVGSTIGSGVGGAILTFSSFQIMFMVLGVFGIMSALVFQWLTVDPSKS
jgi:predicted MFS family arabinose efflux permease